ncbi:twin-arginine translocase TatA/TatE family subunit [Gordonia sp. NPDC058843]|uniref:twin-arginine translocase TatA/TatE family subunit n=1 Tax=Gordonia sp. NPDC058843 TaxID=3346648 RepID=UPI003698CA8B
MFGLTFEKLFLVAVIAGLVLGPGRLPGYAQQLARTIRTLRQFVETTRKAAEEDMGMPLKHTEWQSLNLRQYDPRRIVTDALTESVASTTPSGEQAIDDILGQAARVRPGQTFLVTGTSSHPHRTLIASLPVDDPRRIAASADDMSARRGAEADPPSKRTTM